MLAEAFDFTPPDCDAADLLAWFDDLSGREWDFRGGRERNLANRPALTAEQTNAVLAAAEALGLVTAPGPSRQTYDYCLILGGLVRACITRPRYAAMLSQSGTALHQIVALGGFRPLEGNEVGLARRMNVRAEDEFEAMDIGVRIAFEMTESPTVTTGDGSRSKSDWRIHDYPNHRCCVVAAPSSEPEKRRANSADTYAWWANRTEGLAGSHVLLITNPIYVPYQGAAATEVLAMRFDIDVETVGISACAAHLGLETQSFHPSDYLQEIRSGIGGMLSLYNAAR